MKTCHNKIITSDYGDNNNKPTKLSVEKELQVSTFCLSVCTTRKIYYRA